MDDQGRLASGTLAGIQLDGKGYPVTVGPGLTLVKGTLSASAAGGPTIGDAVSGGTAGGVLYVDASAKLAEAAGVQIDPADGRLFSTTPIASPGTFGSTTRVSWGIVDGRPGIVAEVGGSWNWSFDFDGAHAYLAANGTNLGLWDVSTGAYFYAGVSVQAQDATGTIRTSGTVKSGLSDNAAATWKGYAALAAHDVNDGGTPREGVRAGSDGAQPLVGFFGTAPVAKGAITGSRGGNAALASLLTYLASLGLITDSSTA